MMNVSGNLMNHASEKQQPHRACVLLIHGYANTHSSMEDLAESLMQQGYAVVNWCYASMAQDITASAEQLRQVYEMNAPNYEQVHLVTHSMGGLVVRRFLALSPQKNLGAIVMIAPPNNGAWIAGKIISHPLLRGIIATSIIRWFFGPAAWEMQDPTHIRNICAMPTTRLLIIAGSLPFHVWSPLSFIGVLCLRPPHDGTLTVEETQLPTATQSITIPAPHDLIASDARVIDATIGFLANEPDTEEQQYALKHGRYRNIKSPGNVLGMAVRGGQWLSALPALPPLRLRHRAHHSLCWYDCAVVRGWRLQCHIIFGCYRVLDPDAVERMWGGKQAMIHVFCRQVGNAGVVGAAGITGDTGVVETR